MVGADSLVMKDVPLHSMVTGIPTKVIGYVDDQDPSLNMKHDASKEFFQKVAISCKEARSNGEISLCSLLFILGIYFFKKPIVIQLDLSFAPSAASVSKRATFKSIITMFLILQLGISCLTDNGSTLEINRETSSFD
ncbi:putative serine acetyltransferase 2 [Capsicum chinense]|nr:putative serine acetyltransferase 2 [Capsicum chinense]